jgi:uncharacterized protein (TIGR02594 family)
MITLPKEFQDLAKKERPKLLVEALRLFGTREIVGPQHSSQIMGWAKKLGMAREYTMDETPWCGLFAAVVVYNAEYTPVPGALRALNWAKWGNAADQASLGDVLVFKRPGGGHVGLYVGENTSHYYVLGGNQGNCVCIVLVDKTRCVAVRRPQFKIGQPDEVKPIWRNAAGVVSHDEA